MSAVIPIRDLLRADLVAARRSRDTQMASLIRALIAAVDNAEAVDASEAGGATEVQRRRLSDDDVLNIVLSESAELRHAATEFERRGDPEEARRLRSLAEVADRYAGRFEEHG